MGDAIGLTGMPERRTATRAEMVDGFNSGWIHFGVPGKEHVEGSNTASGGDNSACDSKLTF